jgi:hypothetical protein
MGKMKAIDIVYVFINVKVLMCCLDIFEKNIKLYDILAFLKAEHVFHVGI